MAAAATVVVGCAPDALAAKEAGNAAFQAGRFQEAYDLFSEAIGKDPGSALLRSNRAGALASLGRHQEAYEDAELCVKMQPDWWKGYTRRGHAEFHLHRYAESEQSFQEAMRLNPGERNVQEGLDRARAAQSGVSRPEVPASAAAAAAGAPAADTPLRTAATAAASPAPALAAAPGAVSGVSLTPPPIAPPRPVLQPKSDAGGTADADFQKMSADEVRQRIEQAAAKLSPEALDEELHLAGVKVPRGASHADKVKLYAAGATSPDQPRTNSSNAAVKKKVTKSKSEAERMLERRKGWLEKWSSWDDAQLVKRLRSFGIDGEGLSRNDLMDELLKAETERYERRCDPNRVQTYALALTGCCVFSVFVGVALAFIISSS